MLLQWRESEGEYYREPGCASERERERERQREGERESAHLLHQGSPGEESKRDLSLLPAFAS